MTQENKSRLSEEEREMVEKELYEVFKEVDIKEILIQLRALREIKQELADIEMVLKSAKCCLQKFCNKQNGFFCC